MICHETLRGYEFWATKHNLQVASDTVILMHKKGFKSLAQLDDFIKKSADKRQTLQDEIKVLDEKNSFPFRYYGVSSYCYEIPPNLSGI